MKRKPLKVQRKGVNDPQTIITKVFGSSDRKELENTLKSVSGNAGSPNYTREEIKQLLDDPCAIGADIQLLQTIKDIRDELKIILVVYKDQERVFTEMNDTRGFKVERDEAILSLSIRQRIGAIERIDQRAAEVHHAVGTFSFPVPRSS
jgi:hypothetical protein